MNKRPLVIILGSLLVGIASLLVLLVMDHSRNHVMRVPAFAGIGATSLALPFIVWRWRQVARDREAQLRHATAASTDR